MSEKFGLDWQKYEYKRMSYLIAVDSAIKEKEEIEQRKTKSKSNGRQG